MERRLGRGLGALLGHTDTDNDTKKPASASVRLLHPNRHQPRRTFDADSLSELTASLQRHGVLQPVVVRASGDGFEIISGERRWRAAQQAGMTEVPIVVRDGVSDDEMLELALVENVQREDLNAIERAEAFRAMMNTLRLTQELVAQKVGLRRTTVANHIRLLELPPQVQELVRRGLVSMGHARALLGAPDTSVVLDLVERVVRDGLSVRQVEALVSQRAKASAGSIEVTSGPKAPSAWIRDLEDRLRRRVGAKVEVRNRSGYRGQITIHYSGREDLERLCNAIAPKETL